MTPRHSAPKQRRVRHARKLRRHPLRNAAVLTVLAVGSFAITAGATAYVRLENNIRTHDISDLVSAPPPQPHVQTEHRPTDPFNGRALNFLIMGSDVRDGENAEIGGEVEGMRSDTTIIAHVAADRSRVELVSIPRDTRVDVPACSFLDGSQSRPHSARFNDAFATGARNQDVGEAAACTINTVQAITGIPIDGWVVVDFAGFRNMVDALGGVDMCIPNDMYSEKAGLYLEAGLRHLDGTTALAFARARTGQGLGNGSDINRLGRQQQLMSAIAQEVFRKNLLTDLDELYRFLTAATQSLTADPQLGRIRTLAGLAWSLQDVPLQNIVFLTAPHAPNPADRNEVVFTADAAVVWERLITDQPIVPPAPAAPEVPADPDAPADPNAPADPSAPAAPPAADPPTPGVDPITPADLPTVCG